MLELRLGQACFAAELDHDLGAGTDPFDVSGQIERLRKERVVWDRGMVVAQAIESQRAGERAGVPDFEPIGEEAGLDGGVAVVIAVGDGINDGLTHCVGGQLVGRWRGDAMGAGAYSAVDLGQHEISRLIRLVEKIAAVDLQRGEGTTVLGAVTVDALGLGGSVKALRIGAEE